MNSIAVLLTCHNRKDKTLACLSSLYKAIDQVNGYVFDIYLVDDGSTDGTGEAVRNKFPDVHVIKGNGNLYWAGGMRLAWNTAIKTKNHQAYLLINDDVVLNNDCICKLIEAENFSVEKTGKKGIYVAATLDKKMGEITYGGIRITANHFILKTQKVIPNKFPQKCNMANANILWVSRETVDKIGIFNEKFTHGIADYDYTLLANEKKIPLLLAPGIGGYCSNDHGVNWKNSDAKLKERIAYLKNPKGLAYHEYLYYIKKHFPLYLPYSFFMLWMKTLFPFLWDRFKH